MRQLCPAKMEITTRWFKTMQAVTHPFQFEETLAAGTRTESYLWEVAVLSSLPDSNDPWQIWDVWSEEKKKASFCDKVWGNCSRQLLECSKLYCVWLFCGWCLLWFGFICCSWVQDTVSWRRRLQTKPYHSHLGRSDKDMLSFVYKPTATHGATEYFLFSP